jgi:transcriptional regulator with XRE-family HTH domain
MVAEFDINGDLLGIAGRQIRRLRIEAKMTQKGLSDQAGIFRTYLSRIESGQANPSLAVLGSIATILEVKVSMLLEE